MRTKINTLKDKLETFVWDFKVGDNILYNLDVIERLIVDHNDGGRYCKPISILAVSVIEAILVDFVIRLHNSTNHFPDHPKVSGKRKEIKDRLNKEMTVYQTVYEGEEKKYKRLRNFSYSELIRICEDFKLLGSAGKTYSILKHLSRFRNRVHIKNYFENFEKNESRVFTEKRTQTALDVMVQTFDFFEKNYSRPW